MPRPLLLCTDLDRTLIPNGREPESPAARPRFRQFVAAPDVTLAYVTGRHHALVEQAIAEHNLPWPDYVIGDVGTSIAATSAGPNWLPLPGWQDTLAHNWPGPDALHALFADLPALQPQEGAKQTAFKLSYDVALDVDADALLARMRERLTTAGLTARLIWSIDEAAAIGLLDVLPASAGKYQAVRFLMQALDHDEDTTVFAGDSGNDLDVLISPIRSVLVANAHPPVRELARQRAIEQGLTDRLYCARGDWQGMNGHYSAGILEGVAHFRPDLLERFGP